MRAKLKRFQTLSKYNKQSDFHSLYHTYLDIILSCILPTILDNMEISRRYQNHK